MNKNNKKLSITDKFIWDLHKSLSQPQGKIWYPNFSKLRHLYQKEQAKQDFIKFINSLKQRGYIKIKKLENKKGIILTPKGTEKILKIKFKAEKEKRKREDGKWQMIIFDIPEKKHYLRDLLRERLRLLGYQKLQQSVWICPYDTFKEMGVFIRNHSLDTYVKFFLIEEREV